MGCRAVSSAQEPNAILEMRPAGFCASAVVNITSRQVMSVKDFFMVIENLFKLIKS
jgi:hypothetical protein